MLNVRLKMKNHLGILAVAFILTSCDNSEELVFHESKSISAVRSRSDRFQQLLLGSPSNIYSGKPSVTLRISGLGELEITGSLEGRMLELYSKAQKFDASKKIALGPHPGRGPQAGIAVWGPSAWDAMIFDARPTLISLVVREGVVLGVSIYDSSKGETAVEIKTKVSGWHSFPLSEQDLLALFGIPSASYQWMAE